ncbi:MAG: type II toxin-antitoxin system HicB family antitoxin [Lentihominibacter sp.]
MKLIYPAIFYPFENGNGYTVEVPDLPGCVSEGDTLADAILMGTDAASGWILDELEDGNDLPTASSISDMQPDDGGIVNLLVLDMDAYAEKYGSKAVRKNITIPAYMDTYLENHGMSLSKVVQDAISGFMVR